MGYDAMWLGPRWQGIPATLLDLGRACHFLWLAYSVGYAAARCDVEDYQAVVSGALLGQVRATRAFPTERALGVAWTLACQGLSSEGGCPANRAV